MEEIQGLIEYFYINAYLKSAKRTLKFFEFFDGKDFRSIARNAAKELGLHYRLDPKRFEDPDTVRFFRYGI